MVKPPKSRKFKYISKLGEGGMSTVYLAIQEKLNRKVAVKFLEPSLLKNKETEARFVKEARTAANLQHSNIIQVFDIGKIDDHYYIAMEYLEESLRDRMKRYPQSRMHPEIALDIIEEILKALDYAHFKGVFHRDIKPENIMFRHDSTPVLVDFGIVSVFGSSDNLTADGQSMGTADYMSPEQARAIKKIDGRSDIYSLGIVLFEMLTGEKPYKGESQISVVLQQIEKPVPRLPEELSRYQPLIDKMMAKDREERFSTGAEIIGVLDRILTAPVGSTPKPVVKSTPRTKPSHISQEKKFTPSVTVESSNAHPLNKEGEEHNPIKQLIIYCFESCKDFVNSFKTYPPKKQVKILGIVVFAVIVLAVILNLLSSGYNLTDREASPIRGNLTKKEAAAEKQPPLPIEQHAKKQQSGEQKPVEEEHEEQKSEKQFQEKYKLALQYIVNEEYEKAEPLVKELKKLKDTKEVKNLERKIYRWKDAEYDRYLSQAFDFYEKKKYFKAQICIIQARQFKTEPTLELKALEAYIKKELKERRKKR